MVLAYARPRETSRTAVYLLVVGELSAILMSIGVEVRPSGIFAVLSFLPSSPRQGMVS